MFHLNDNSLVKEGHQDTNCVSLRRERCQYKLGGASVQQNTFFTMEGALVFVREGCGKSKWKFKMAFAIKRPTPRPLDGKISRHFFTPLFFFCN